MKALLELHNSVYPSNIKPVPNLRKCMPSVNKAEAAPLQFSPHSGGENSISGESMVSLWFTHSKGSGGKRGCGGVCTCLYRPLYHILYIYHLYYLLKMLLNHLNVTALAYLYFQSFAGLVKLQIHLNVLHQTKMQQCQLRFAATVLYCHTSCPPFTYEWCVSRRGFGLSRATTV